MRKRSRKEYQAWYYQEHKEEIARRRRHLYRTDPEYKRKVDESSRRSKQRKKEERERLIAEGKMDPPVRKPVTYPDVLVNGERKKTYSISRAAKGVDRSIDTLKLWNRVGLLPKSPIPHRNNLYTDGMILVMRMAISKRGEVSVKDRGFRREIEEGWRELGIYGDIKLMR